MTSDMLLLAERLVVAMETMSQGVKNMSSYLHDISCSVSYLVNEKRGKQYNSVVAHDYSENPPSGASAAGQEASAELVYSEQHEQADEESSLHIAEPEHGESDFGDIAPTNIDPLENSGLLFQENNPIGIKIEEQPKYEVSEEICDVHNMYGNSKNVDRECATHLIRIAEEDRTQQMGHAKEASAAHTSVVSEERPYKCSVCEKSFKSHNYLERHLILHNGERPYKCGVCTKAFAQKVTLGDHMRTHTGEKPYKCTLCGKAFGHRTSLARHILRHSADRPFQ